MSRNSTDSRHSTADGRRPAARSRDSSLVTRHSSLVTSHSALCIALAALLAASVGAETTGSYVRDGLLACWDGVENAGDAANWVDVVGGRSFTLNNVIVADDSIVFKGDKTSYGILDEADTTATFGAAANGTLEIVYASATGTGSQVILQSSSGSGILYSIYNTSTIIACTASAPTATFTSGTATNTAAIRYSNSKPASFVVNGTGLATGSNDNFSGANKTTVIGNRTTHANAHFKGAIYCIRLYDRQLSDAEAVANFAVDRRRFLEGRAVYGAVSVAQANGVWHATTELLKGSGEVCLHVVSPQGATNILALSNGVVAAPATFTTTIPGLAADTIYSAFASIVSGVDTNVTQAASFFNGPVSVVATADATPTTPGVFTVSRPAADGATNMPLTVSFTLSGTAVAGTHYARIPSCVTIPAGAASATVEIAAVRDVAATTSLTLTLSGETHLPGDSPSATMSVTTVRAPAALVWSAGTSATELSDVANWTPSVPAFITEDTLSFTGDGTSAYRFTLANDLTVKSFAFANGTSPAVVDLGGHTLSNDTVNTTGSFKQTGAGPLVLQNGTLAARTWSFASPELAMTNVFLVGNGDWMTTTLVFSQNNARYLFDNVTLRLCQSWYAQVTFKGADFAVDARNMVNVYPYYVPQLVIGGSNAALRFHGAETRLRCGLNMSGRDNRVTVSDGRLYGASGGTQGNITMTGTNLELVVTNTLGDRCESCIPYLDSATRCAIRVLKGGNYAIMRIDDNTTSAFAIDGCSNLIEVADGTLTLPTLRFGHRDGATFGGNELSVHGDEAVVTFGNGCYVGNIDQPPVTLSFAPGPNGFGRTAPVRQTNSGKNVFIATNTVFKVDARTLTRTRDHGRFALPLMSFRSNTQAEGAFTAETLATFNKNLVSQPRGGKLSLETDGNYRVLTWNYDKRGTVLILR